MALIKCSECNHPISTDAKQCPDCGNPVMHEKKKTNGRLIFVLLIFIMFALIGIMTDKQKQSPEQLRRTVCDNPVGAYRFTKNFVKLTLKAPATAEFPAYSSTIVRSAGQCRYVINSYVDSQNGFGAVLRTSYSMDVQYDMDSDKWTILEQDIVR